MSLAGDDGVMESIMFTPHCGPEDRLIITASGDGVTLRSGKPLRWLSPANARTLATWLIQAADHAVSHGCPERAMMP